MVLSSISLIQNVMSGGSNARSETDAESPFLSTMHCEFRPSTRHNVSCMVPRVCGVGRRAMASVSTVVIYSPPKAGLPYLVVTIANGEVVDSIPVVSRDAARAMIAQKSTYAHGLSPEAVRH